MCIARSCSSPKPKKQLLKHYSKSCGRNEILKDFLFSGVAQKTHRDLVCIIIYWPRDELRLPAMSKLHGSLTLLAIFCRNQLGFWEMYICLGTLCDLSSNIQTNQWKQGCQTNSAGNRGGEIQCHPQLPPRIRWWSPQEMQSHLPLQSQII